MPTRAQALLFHGTASPRRRHALAIAMVASLVTTGTSAHAADKAVVETITVQGRTNQGSMRPGALRDEIVKTESFSEAAIERAGATNINEALDKNPGIAVQVECSICNVRNVLLNNLPGRYTTLLIDGIPIYSSVSSAYGLDSVSVWGVERIDVARGAGASLIAPEALSGTVNMVTKRPQADALQVRLQGGSYGSWLGDAYIARPFEGGALVGTFNYNRHDTVDANKDGISEFTGFERRMGGVGYFLDNVGGFRIKGRLDIIDENRGGGAMGKDYDAIMADTRGNPFDFSAGPSGSPSPDGWFAPDGSGFIPYDAGAGGFSEIIFTNRAQFVTSAEGRVGTGRLRLAFGAARHKQDSFYEISTYKAIQHQYYAEASYQWSAGEWLLTGGLNYRYEDLESHGYSAAADAEVIGIDNYVYRTPAVFGQAYRTFFDDRLELNASLRIDAHNVYGTIYSPRLNMLWHHTDRVSSRVSAGRGFRAPTSFFEQDHGILDDIAIVRRIDKPEVSTNLSYALNYADARLAVTASYNYNRIDNFAILQAGMPDPSGGAGTVTVFTADPHPVTVQGIDLNLSYQLTPGLIVSPAFEYYHYDFHPGTLVFARPETRAYLSLDYDSGPWDLSLKLVWTGPQDLKRFYDYANTPRYNFDGTPKRDKSPAFTTLDLRGEYRFSPHYAAYLGADNVLGTQQIDNENFLWIDSAGAYDVTQFWGPSRGRYIYAGVKASF